MADVYTVSSGSNPVASGVAETVLQLVGGTQRVRVNYLSVSFDGAASATPALVTVTRQTTAGTSSAATIVPVDADSPACIATALKTFTAEPSDGVDLYQWYVTPNGGLFQVSFAPGEEIVVDTSGGTQPRLGIVVNVPTACNVVANFAFTE